MIIRNIVIITFVIAITLEFVAWATSYPPGISGGVQGHAIRSLGKFVCVQAARGAVASGSWGWRRRPSHHLLTRPAIKGHHSFLQQKAVTLELGGGGGALKFPQKKH